jgi:hypothetical protein
MYSIAIKQIMLNENGTKKRNKTTQRKTQRKKQTNKIVKQSPTGPSAPQ